MANWRSYIDPSVGDGQNTLDGIIANGPTYGIGISDDLSVTGLSTFSDVARFSNTVRLDGQLRDGDNNFGTSGQVLSSDGTDTRWVSSGSLAAGAASLVAINDDGNTDASRFITFVDSSSGNNALKTDSVIKYNPSTNILNLNATASGIKFGPGNATNDDAHIEWLGGNNAGHLRISTSDDNGTEYIQFGDYDTQNRGGTFTQWLRISRNTGAFTGTFSATTFSGSGASLTSLNASNISSGTINAARVPTLNQNTTGSAATLTTARTIGGVSFDGSANINLPGVNQDGNQNTSGNAATATVLETTRNFSISGEITANAQSFNGSGNVTLSATVDNNVIDEANLKISNSPSNGKFLQCNTGVSGGLTWADVTIPSSNTLSGTTLASGITASSITSLGTLTGLSVNGNASVTGTLTSGALTIDVNGTDDGATTLLTLDNYIADIGTEYTWIDFTFRDSNANATPQVKIGAQVQDPTGNQTQEGTADFVVQCGVDGNASSNTMTEMFRCSHEGKITSKHHHPQTDSSFDLGTNSTRWRNGYFDNVYGNGSNLTSLNASQLSSGTIPTDRLPNHSASLLTSGTIPAARLPNHSASLLTSGTLPAARLGTLPQRIGLNVSVTGTPATRNAFLALGDTDTGVAQNGDGQLELWANNQEIVNLDTNNVTSYKSIIPSSDSSFNLGSSSNRWSNVYADTLYGSGANLTSVNYNNLTNKPTIPTNNNQLTNGRGFITATDVRSMNEAASTGTSSTTSTVFQDKVTLSISTVSNSRVLVLFGFEIKHSRNNNQSTTARVTGDNISFVGGNYQVSHNNLTWTEFQGQRLDISSHTGTRTYRIQWSRSADTGSIRNAYLVAIEMSV